MKNLKALREVQKELAAKVIVKDEYRKPLKRIAGIDLAFTGELAVAACVVNSFPQMKAIYKKTAIEPLDFPYIPTFLSFREGPPIIRLMKSLDERADIYLINAQGLAHPLYCGCASHIGVLTDEATIGVASSNLCGIYSYEPKNVREAVSIYFDGRKVGWILKSKKGCKPIFVSPGHRIGLDSSLTIVKRCIIGHKLPEPLWQAHRLADEERRRVK